jgi:hypothetical protein
VKRIEDVEVRPIGEDAGIVTYNAIYDRDGREAMVAATTVYVRGRDGWKGILYQQTPIAS